MIRGQSCLPPPVKRRVDFQNVRLRREGGANRHSVTVRDLPSHRLGNFPRRKAVDLSDLQVCPLRSGKGSIAAEPGADRVGRFDSEMIRAVAHQTGDVGMDGTVRVPILALHRSVGAVVGSQPILETNSRAQPMRVE